MTIEQLKLSIKIKKEFFAKDNISKKSVDYIKGYMKCLDDILESIREYELDEIFDNLNNKTIVL